MRETARPPLHRTCERVNPMNLLTTPWLTVLRQDGSEDIIAANAMTSGSPPVDLLAVRPDFRGALYQFLIGLLQTAYAPADQDEWRERWHQPPDLAALKAAFAPYLDAFELAGKGPAFMQDFDLPEAEQTEVAALLIDAPGGKTVRDNLDHFVHRGVVEALCPICAATALFTLQINAPSGGVGHRVSVRGGGPLTTLLLPTDPAATLWQKLWLNVMPADALAYPPVKQRGDVLPWTVPTRTSDARGVGDTTPESVHALQAYWSMPRRIRLDWSEADGACCDLCGAASDTLVRHYRTRNYGTNYTGAWLHPLTPYSLDPKGANPPLSIKGQRGGVGYRHWLGLVLGNDDHQPDAAQVVRHFQARVRLPGVRLWCFGYDMDNMKARCWYDATLPVHAVAREQQMGLAVAVKAWLDVAKEVADLLHKWVRAAWFERPGDAGPAPSVPQSFWQQSEPAFYTLLDQVAKVELSDEAALAPLHRDWLRASHGLALRLFDDWVLAAPIEGMNIERVVTARSGLSKGLNTAKPMKPLWQIVNTYEKEAA
ncbi:type I-E CRISPR-associated protein Cse1/CasA [Ralstonia solanacearum]|uniref:type I-E CRISPR-associated protein Cse1/CasA n=1 Tax=Ralstonia solanacearum TaxID=305 RepID=UPI003CC6177E